MDCPNCGSKNSEHSNECDMCGFGLTKIETSHPEWTHCIECGEQIGTDFIFCDLCGAEQSNEDSPDSNGSVPYVASPPEAEEAKEENDGPEPHTFDEVEDEAIANSLSAASEDESPNVEVEETRKNKGRVFPLVAVFAAVAAGSMGFIFGMNQSPVDVGGQEIDAASDVASTPSLDDQPQTLPEIEDSLEAENDEAPSQEKSDDDLGQSDTANQGEAINASENSDSQISVENSEDEPLGFRSWATTISVESSEARVLIGPQCPAAYCSIQTVTFAHAELDRFKLEPMLVTLSFLNLQSEEVQSQVLELRPDRDVHEIDLVVGYVEGGDGYVPVGRVEMEFSGVSDDVDAKAITASSLDLSSFADGVTQPIEGYLSDYARTIPGLESLKKELTSAGICESFGEVDNSGRIACRHSSVTPNSMGLLAAIGPLVDSWKKYGSRSKNGELVVLGQGWAFTFFAEKPLSYLDQFRQMGALYFISSELPCHLKVSGPNELRACIAF